MALTTFTYTCSNNAVGGIRSLYLADHGTAITPAYTAESTSREVSGITLDTNYKFWQCAGMDDTITFTETSELINNKIVYKPEIKVNLGSRTKTNIDYLMNFLACTRICAVIIDNSGTVTNGWATGYVYGQGLRFMGSNIQTGANVTEDTFVEFTLGHPFGMMKPTAPLASGFTLDVTGTL